MRCGDERLILHAAECSHRLVGGASVCVRELFQFSADMFGAALMHQGRLWNAGGGQLALARRCATVHVCVCVGESGFAA